MQKSTITEMDPVLQVALDFMNLDRAINLADEAVKGGVDWIEVGTPLIKSEGLDAVREIKKKFPDHTILADMKTIDIGRIEVEMAAKSGADIVIVLGISDDTTMKECVDASRNYGCKLMADLINVSDPLKRSKELEGMGVDYICIHVGIDQQMQGINPIKELERVSSIIRTPLGIAGGINSETAAEAIKAGASIVVVGGAITKAKNAVNATRKIKRAILTQTPVKTHEFKKYTEITEIKEVLEKVSTANISDALHRTGHMTKIMSVVGGLTIVGQAVTVRTYPGDWAKTVEAIDKAKSGEVIVIDAGGVGPAVWGELASWSCMKKGISGVVIDGAIRDIPEIKKLKFPAFSKIVMPTAGEPKGFGEINIPIKCGGVVVRPGDWVVGDDDGVVIIPHEKAIEITNRALDVLEKEDRIRKEIQRGSTLSKILKLKKWERVT